MDNKFLLGVYDSEQELLDGVKAVRKEGVRIKDVLMPFHVHGIEDAMGWGQTRIPTAGFIFGIIGCATALGGMGWINSVDWPINFGGKPFFSLPAYIPITFELTVLFSAVGMVAVFLISSKLAPGIKKPILDKRATDDKFIIVLQNNDSLDEKAAEKIMKDTGAIEVNNKDLDD